MNTYSETILFDLPLPQFFIQVKDKCIFTLVPKINQLILDIQTNQNISSVLTIAMLFVLISLGKQIIANLFARKSIASQPLTQSQIDQQIRNLGTQIKNLKNSLKKITQQTTEALNNNSFNHPISKSEDGNKLINFYRETAQDFKNLAEYVMETQETILKQLKNIKKLKNLKNKNSSQGSREDYIADTTIQHSKETQKQQTTHHQSPNAFQIDFEKQILKTRQYQSTVSEQPNEKTIETLEIVEKPQVKPLRQIRPQPPPVLKKRIIQMRLLN